MEGSRHINSQDLIGLYVNQLLNGCKNSECNEAACATGRQNINVSPSLRGYSTRSARAIALAFAGGPNPRAHLCRFVETIPAVKSRRKDSSADTSIDASSIEQLLCSTYAFENVCTNGAQEVTDSRILESQRLYLSLDPLFESFHGSQSKPPSNEEAAKLIVNCFYWINNTHLGPGKTGDDYDSPHKLRLMLRVFEGISLRLAVEHVLDKRAALNVQRHQQNRRLSSMLLALLLKPDTETDIYGNTMCPLRWARNIFLTQWDYSPALRRGNAVCGALEFMESVYDAAPTRDLESHDSIFQCWDRIDIFEGLKPFELASSWIKMETDDTCRHILSFEFLLHDVNTPARTTLFRTINHLRMQEMHTKARIAWKLRERYASITVPLIPKGRLKHAEGVYLLLNVSREGVLRDAFDQIWQRRSDELLRPLRVRLGESNQIEVGQDLGGVQIEFFNLVCKAVFASDSELFDFDSTSNYSYFRPMSLQPLYRFEMLGLLMALALYNGITLPLNLPLFFYRHIIHGVLYTSTENSSTEKVLDDIKDIWPNQYKSLSFTRQNPDTIDYYSSFPLEANGLRMEVRPTGQYHGDRIVLEIFNVSPIRHYDDSMLRSTTALPSVAPVDIEAIADEWPGWHLVEAQNEPSPVSTDDFIRDYVHWLTYGSVQPQLESFKKGFETVVGHRSLSLLTPHSFQKLFEGTTELDIKALQKSVTYKGGYSHLHPYVRKFWNVVNAWSPETQMQLVKFVTAAERIPNGGPESLTFVIDKAGPMNEEALPTSSTCFGELKLPVYKTQEILEQKLLLAMRYGLEGFGTA